MDQTFSLVLERREAEGRLSVAKIMSIKKGSPALMVNVDKGREIFFGGDFDDIKCQRSLNEWSQRKLEIWKEIGDWSVQGELHTITNF